MLAWVETYRAILLSLVMDIVCLMMPWIALRLRQAREAQLAGHEPPTVEPIADEAHMLSDLRGQEPIEPEVDAYFEDIAARRSEAARKGWNKRKMRVQTREGGAFETAGVVEERLTESPSDERVVRAPEAAPVVAPAAVVAPVAAAVAEPEPVAELTEEEELLALYGEDAVALPDGEGVMVGTDEAPKA
jgi:hypothetical protein